MTPPPHPLFIPFGLYIHWPFCRSKCPYCDFNSHVRGAVDHAAWKDALLAELRYWAARTPHHRLQTIFFGGGTPSLMEPATVAALVDEARRLWPAINDLEISLEANPTSSEAENFAGYAAAGVNRVSLGVQSLRDDQLKFLGRQHSVDEAKEAIALAARLFPRSSFDLIYARPHQTRDDWRAELQEALTLAPEHISLYQLTIEPNTGFARAHADGKIPLPVDTLAAEMYDDTTALLAEHGFEHYEVSNYAKSGAACRHNLGYWHYDDYIGIGPGAHGRVQTAAGRLATVTHKSPERWLRAVAENGHGLDVIENIPIEDAQREALLMGLRLKDGISRVSWQEKFSGDLLNLIPPTRLQALIDNGDIAAASDRLEATPQGRLRLNAVLDYLFN